MNPLERSVRAHVLQTLRRTSSAPRVADMAAVLGIPEPRVTAALHSLAEQHRLVLLPGSDAVWMAHPFSAVVTDFVVHSGPRRWYANCVWDGLSILGLVGDGRLETSSPASGAAICFDVSDDQVTGDDIVHFLVPARQFWDDIAFT